MRNLPESASGTYTNTRRNSPEPFGTDPHRHTPELIWAEDPISLRCWGKMAVQKTKNLTQKTNGVFWKDCLQPPNFITNGCRPQNHTGLSNRVLHLTRLTHFVAIRLFFSTSVMRRHRSCPGFCWVNGWLGCEKAIPVLGFQKEKFVQQIEDVDIEQIDVE